MVKTCSTYSNHCALDD